MTLVKLGAIGRNGEGCKADRTQYSVHRKGYVGCRKDWGAAGLVSAPPILNVACTDRCLSVGLPFPEYRIEGGGTHLLLQIYVYCILLTELSQRFLSG
jgi:hypothetical protein